METPLNVYILYRGRLFLSPLAGRRSTAHIEVFNELSRQQTWTLNCIVVPTMKKHLLALLLFAVVPLLTPLSSWGGFCIGICIGGGGDIPNGFIYSRSEDSETMTTSRSADAFEAPFYPFNGKNNPKRILFYDSKDRLLGGATQIDPKELVYVTARHVLAGQREVSLRTDDSTEILLSDFYIFQGKASFEAPWLDALLLIPKTAFNSSPTAEEVIAMIASTSRLPRPQSKWFSWQYGIFDDRITDGFASGLLVEKKISDLSPYFWLDAGTSNYTAPGSSGSVVWQPVTSSSHSLLPIGVIQCMEHPSVKERESSSHLPKPRFLSLFYLANEPLLWEGVEAKDLLQGPLHPQEVNCTPIDGRQGGGF